MNRRRIVAACAAGALLALAVPAMADDPWGLMPESASADADRIDDLVYLILWVTGITFVGVQLALLWFLVRYRRREGVKAKHTHGNHTVEMVWTVAPAAILVFLAVYQMGLWAEVKAQKPEDNTGAIEVRIYARQFEWLFWLPGPDAAWDTPDDVTGLKTLVVPKDRPVNCEMRAMDVLHSFFLPNLRFKQDAVPGLHTKIWFRPNKYSVDRKPLRSSKGADVKLDHFDVVCAELCGNQHTTMRAKLFVVTDEQYASWLRGEEVVLSTGTKVPKATKFSALYEPYDFIWSTWKAQDDQTVDRPPTKIKRPFGQDFPEEETEEETEEGK